MRKINVVLVVLNRNFLADALRNLNFNKIELCAVVMDNGGEKFLKLGEKSIPSISFPAVDNLEEKFSKAVWLIIGCRGDGDFRKMQKFLSKRGVGEDNIINFALTAQINPQQTANLLYAKEKGTNFFVTGGSCFEVGLDLNRIPSDNGCSVNLSCSGQTLRQSYLTAQHIFETVKRGSVKFVLIGLTPHSLLHDAEDNARDRLFPNLIGDNVTNISGTNAAQADLNFDALRTQRNGELTAEAITDWSDDAQFSTDKISGEQLQILREYIRLCQRSGAKPVGIVLPVAAAMRKNYSPAVLTAFRKVINRLQEKTAFKCIDLFDFNLSDGNFADMTHLNLKGATQVSTFLGARLYIKGILAARDVLNMNADYFDLLSKSLPRTYKRLMEKLFADVPYKQLKQLAKVFPKDSYGALIEKSFFGMKYDRFKKLPAADGDAVLDGLLDDKTYNYFLALAERLSKDDYNALMARTLNIAAQRIRRKYKIKLGFVLYSASMWCGDEIYNAFARDDRFETKIFFCLKKTNSKNELVQADYWQGVKRFKAHDLNVVTVTEKNPNLPAQDVLILLTPYYGELPKIFRPTYIKLTTLIVNIPYSLSISKRPSFLDGSLFYVLWKMFFTSRIQLELHDKTCRVGMPRGVYSGYPKMDIFFQNVDFKFDWKMARPDAKKIIWAPHHSITDKGVCYATFRWNHQFMYEFAKAHPEISWVVKPHPYLHHAAIKAGIFPSVEAVKAYFQKWDELPNAQVYTGAYYQAIFATSDGMIHDSGSFIAEYQYVDKPMIFLTRKGGKFNELGEMILSASYCVDGQDLPAVAALMQKIFIDGNDYKVAERRKLFDEQLNYPKYNGMSASEFVYRNIAEELRAET